MVCATQLVSLTNLSPDRIHDTEGSWRAEERGAHDGLYAARVYRHVRRRLLRRLRQSSERNPRPLQCGHVRLVGVIDMSAGPVTPARLTGPGLPQSLQRQAVGSPGVPAPSLTTTAMSAAVQRAHQTLHQQRQRLQWRQPLRAKRSICSQPRHRLVLLA